MRNMEICRKLQPGPRLNFASSCRAARAAADKFVTDTQIETNLARAAPDNLFSSLYFQFDWAVSTTSGQASWPLPYAGIVPASGEAR